VFESLRKYASAAGPLPVDHLGGHGDRGGLPERDRALEVIPGEGDLFDIRESVREHRDAGGRQIGPQLQLGLDVERAGKVVEHDKLG